MEESTIRTDHRSWQKMPAQYLAAFLAVVFMLGLYSYNVRQQLLVAPLTPEEIAHLSSLIQSSDALAQHIGAVHRVTFSEGIYDEQRNRYIYQAQLETGSQLESAEIRIIRSSDADIVSAVLVQYSLSELDAFSINLTPKT